VRSNGCVKRYFPFSRLDLPSGSLYILCVFLSPPVSFRTEGERSIKYPHRSRTTGQPVDLCESTTNRVGRRKRHETLKKTSTSDGHEEFNDAGDEERDIRIWRDAEVMEGEVVSTLPLQDIHMLSSLKVGVAMSLVVIFENNSRSTEKINYSSSLIC